MEENVLPLTSVLGGAPSDSFMMDLDYMDQLLVERCWFEAHESEFLNFDASTPISPFEPSFLWSTLEENTVECGRVSSKEERRRSSFPEYVSISQAQDALGSLCQPDNYGGVEGSEPTKSLWFGPRASTSITDRLIEALGYIKDLSKDKDALIQVWVPVNRGGKRVLTTNDRLVSVDLNCPSLAQYREISRAYEFPTEEDSKEPGGLPGRVFRNKIPEWTPDVRFFSMDEYPRVGYAQKYDISGTLAVPVMERGSRTCLGVIEVVLTTRKLKYGAELESVCKALEAVDLRTSEVPEAQNVKTSDLFYQTALPEILEVLQSACKTHGLPLAQTWVPCVLQGKGGCRHSDDNLENCLSTVDSACYIGDSRIQGFHEACSEYHLLKGQGIVGKAFRTNQPCFSPDITSFSKTEYPISHHARMFGLQAAVAIRLRSICTGSADFVLEFFLPIDCKDLEEQKKMLTSLSHIIRNVCRTLRVVTDQELQQNFTLPDEELIISPATTRFSQGPGSNSREGVTFVTKPSTSGDGSSLYTNRTEEKRRTKADKTITLQVLRQHFAGSLKDAAKNLGVCPTTLKRICRQHGIQKWPSRKFKKVGHSLQKIQRVIDSVQGASGVLQIESFYSNFPELASPNASKTSLFSNFKSTDNVQPMGVHPESFVSSPPAATSVSLSTSYSQSSGSSGSCSNGTPPKSFSLSIPCNEESVFKDEYADGMKSARSDANLHLSSDEPKLLQRSQSQTSLYMTDKPEDSPPTTQVGGGIKALERVCPRVKVTFGEEKIRFRIQHSWGYKDLYQEICRRFGLGDTQVYHLKYLDDDAEWVLLTCDEDLVECVDVCHSSQCDTIKLQLGGDSQTHFGSSFGSRDHSS